MPLASSLVAVLQLDSLRNKMLYEDYKNDLMELDPVELLEKFNITSWDLIERFEERIEADTKKQERDIRKQMALDYRKKVAEVRAKDKDNFTKRIVQLKEQYKKDVSDRVLKETDRRKKLVLTIIKPAPFHPKSEYSQ